MLADWINYYDLALLNTPSISTFYSNHIQDWAITKFGEKLFCQLSPLQNELQAYSYILSSNSSLKSLEQINVKRSYEATLNRLDDIAERYTSAILYAAHDAIPQIRLAPHAKPWWNDSLKSLRRDINRAREASKRAARNIYFQAIKTAKKDHWNQFLEKEDSKSIFKALAYMKLRRLELTLFPPPPKTASPNWTLYTASEQWQWPKLALDEVNEIKSTSPGPDYITQTIITHLSLLFETLVNTGYYPKC
ncbi:hypothetical protein LHYA1_G009113 [Lachnellula hyalina]|uniref:Uncharacterized protein n=1 Tax=Lachnellula hyalina TaxID=1316788 RepID=A0A8H8QU92_9HELO|nr:uncharacterized protein LHYA1_G009113 [Lachnellula hyalina]TVY22236.1 hypothetical protein LHYA1_G009113 [Lachnellula hyalina]